MPAEFLNADLDIFSAENLQPLIDEIGDRAMLLHSGPFTEALPFMARYEIDFDPATKSPENLIHSFCALISGLSPQGRALWDASREREINLGYKVSGPPERIMDQISPGALGRMADLEITLAWTFYPAGEFASQEE